MQVFSWKFSEILKNNFFTEHLRITASGHFRSLNSFTFFAIIWTNRNQAFDILNMFYHGFQAWGISWALHLENFTKQTTHRSSRSHMFFKNVFLKISQISQVLSKEICEMFTFLQKSSGGCFLTQLLLLRKTHFSEIPRGTRLINWLTFIYMLNFCILYCNSLLKSHRSGHQWCSVKKALRNIHRKAPLFLIKKETY